MELKKMLKSYKFWLIVAVLILTSLLVYSPHFNYKYPLHADEWIHIYQVRMIGIHSYDFASSQGFEVGFDLFLLFVQKLGLDLVLMLKYFPAIFAIIASLILFSFVYYLTKNYFASLFSMIFFAALPSNVNLLGVWFAIPLTLAIPLIYLSIFLFYKGFEESSSKFLIWALIVILLIFFIHAPSAFFVIFVLSLFLLINYKEKDKFSRVKKALISYPIVLLIFAVSIIIFLRRDISWIISRIIFEQGWTSLEPSVMDNPYLFHIFHLNLLVSPYFLPLLFGFIPFILALFGLYYSFKHKKLNILTIWFFYSLILIFIFVNFKISIFIPYQRMLYYCLLVLVPLAGIGLERIINYITGYKKDVRIVLISILIVLVFFAAFHNYEHQPQGMEVYHLASDSNYNALIFLKDYTTNERVLAMPKLGTIIFPISYNRPLADLFEKDTEKGQDATRFFSVDCNEKETILKKWDVDYVYSETQLSCGWKEIYNKESYIYKVK